MVISLIGFRGVGKSSVGPQLASRLGWECVDADVEIAARAGKSIPEIFAQDGEPAFRRLEVDVLIDLLHRDRLVIATGGGAVMNEPTRRAMHESGPVVWLQASLETIWTRIGTGLVAGGDRPALTNQDPRTEVELLLQRREPVYAATASLIVSTDGRTVTAIVDDIVARLPKLAEPAE
jgi:shikimate kinase